ncbi:hypothetical protein [Roseicyclus sp.]|uniref:hypothetical protein n=1 Tax=Roseicyclus sp. TaxID=1914329 RepID=UPI003F6BD8EB
MRRLLVAAMVAAAFMAGGSAALAQGVPAEIPSASFRGDQYVDSRGCAFVRVGVGNNIQWVPRVGRDRRQLCGLAPSGGANASRVAATAPRNQPGVTVIGGAATAGAAVRTAPAVRTATSATVAPRPVIIAPPVPAAPALRSVGTQPRPPAAQPRRVATTPRPMPPAASGACTNLPADIRGYFAGADPRCGPQAVHPGDAARGVDRTSALGGTAQPAIRQLVRYQVNPPAGYRAAWDDGRLNPYRGLSVAGGQRQMEQVWTNSLPRRLVGTPARGLNGLLSRDARDAGPATLVPAHVVIVRP